MQCALDESTAFAPRKCGIRSARVRQYIAMSTAHGCARRVKDFILNEPMFFRTVVLICFVAAAVSSAAQHRFVAFGQEKTTSAHCIYVDDAAREDARQFVFGSVTAALQAVERQQKMATRRPAAADTAWTEIYVAPSVYWLDDPDNPTVRTAEEGDDVPYGLKAAIGRVRLVGLSADAEDVVLACQRGQTQGAVGNFTMLRIVGDDFEARNITFGNYTNVDLHYRRRPALSRSRRAEPIVQAQLAVCEGDRYSFSNCRFISRLNLCPFVGPPHVRYDGCYFECTDDALCGTGEYVRCRFTWFSSKPFYSTWGRGATLRDCDIVCKTRGTQYFTKVSSPIRLFGCRFTSDDPELHFAWTRRPDPRDRCVMEGCTLNGRVLSLPPTPDVPMSVSWPHFEIANESRLVPGRWTYDACCPADVGIHAYAVDTLRAAWVYGEGMDGAEGVYGLIQNVRGARMRYTGRRGEHYGPQRLCVTLDPCKAPGQGFGSATGQYLDVCVKYDTQTDTGVGIRFERTVRHDRAVDVSLIAYQNATVTALTAPAKCTLFRRGCRLTLTARDGTLTAEIRNGDEAQTMTARIGMSDAGGILLQHTGTTGASATVIGALQCEYD